MVQVSRPGDGAAHVGFVVGDGETVAVSLGGGQLVGLSDITRCRVPDRGQQRQAAATATASPLHVDRAVHS